jgi:hypothetical protein
MEHKFCIFILTHGRPKTVYTYDSLRKHGYTGDIILICDDEDPALKEYRRNFDLVEVFSKKEIAQTFDVGDNFDEMKAVVYARNACFGIAKKLGYNYFMQYDDDYKSFEYRIYSQFMQVPSTVWNLDAVFQALMEFYVSSPFTTISIAQGGDFIGGKMNNMAMRPTIYRKCMNSFICSVNRPFQFIGRINEDVNAYTCIQSRGVLMGMIPLVSLTQHTTQKNKGGLTEIYLKLGTYVKSFYSVMFMPSACSVKMMGDKHMRLHHSVNWNSAVPKIISEKHRK